MQNGIMWGKVLPKVGAYIIYKRKSPELRLVHILEPLVKFFLKPRGFT
jgi:hypothetical protein